MWLIVGKSHNLDYIRILMQLFAHLNILKNNTPVYACLISFLLIAVFTTLNKKCSFPFGWCNLDKFICNISSFNGK